MFEQALELLTKLRNCALDRRRRLLDGDFALFRFDGVGHRWGALAVAVRFLVGYVGQQVWEIAQRTRAQCKPDGWCMKHCRKRSACFEAKFHQAQPIDASRELLELGLCFASDY